MQILRHDGKSNGIRYLGAPLCDERLVVNYIYQDIEIDSVHNWQCKGLHGVSRSF